MELPHELPVMTLPSATLFPQALMPLYIFEPRYQRMLRDALHSHRMFTVAMQRPDRQRENPCVVAGLGLIRVSVRHSDGTSHLILQGLTRVQLHESVQAQPYRVHRCLALPTPPDETVAVEALVSRVTELVGERLRTGTVVQPFPISKPGLFKGTEGKPDPFAPEQVMKYLRSLSNPEAVADLVSCTLLSKASQRQAILETVNLQERFRKLIRFLMSAEKQPRKQ